MPVAITRSIRDKRWGARTAVLLATSNEHVEANKTAGRWSRSPHHDAENLPINLSLPIANDKVVARILSLKMSVFN